MRIFSLLYKCDYVVEVGGMDTANSTAQGSKTKPIPTRFNPAEDDFLHDAAKATGLPVSELVRRSVRLMRRQKSLVNSFSFVLDLAA